MKWHDFRTYQKHFSELVELERKEEINRHMNEIKRLSPQKREAFGRAILNTRSRDAGRGIGGTYLVKYVRPNGMPDHEIAVGDLIIPSSGHPNGKEPQATVTEKTNFSLTVAFNEKPPSFAYQKRVRIDLFANDITFQRMLEAIDSLKKEAPLTRLLLGKMALSKDEQISIHDHHNPKLNALQKKAVEQSVQAKRCYLIHGPPGTGKTTTLTESILQHIQRGAKVLATADSNTATDNLVEMLAKQGAQVIRVGHPARITKALLSHSLDYQLQQTEAFQESTACWEQIDQLKEKQKQYIVPSGPNRRGLRDKQIRRLAENNKSSRGLSNKKIKGMAKWLELQKSISSLAQQAQKLEQEGTVQLLNKADVICTTHSSAGGNTLTHYTAQLHGGFDVVAIDEATQSIEPACLISMTKGQKYIMAGDHKQLPPTVLNQKAATDLQNTLFERLTELYGTDIKTQLTVQYRMQKDIMRFPSESFYDGQLEAHESVAHHTLEDLPNHNKEVAQETPQWLQKVPSPQPTALFLDAGQGSYDEKQRKRSTSFENPVEAEIIVSSVVELLESGVLPNQIGVISPYNNQVDRLNKKLEDVEELEIKTVDGFQGREKEVILISFVRSNPEGTIGFLSDKRRLNVSITRAKRKLIMVGDAATLRHDPFYRSLLEAHPCLYIPHKEKTE